MIHIIYCLEFGIIIAIAIGLILGIQFVTTGVEGQAKIKEKILPYIIGCIVVFGGFGIWRAVIILSSDTLDNCESIVKNDEDTKTKTEVTEPETRYKSKVQRDFESK